MATSNLNNNRPIQNNKFIYFCKKIWSGITYFFYRYRFLWQRIGIALITLALTTILSFVLIRSMPGDIIESYARELAAQRNISIEEATRLAVQILNYDPNENIFVSFGRYLSGLFQGNLGTSMYIDGLTVNEVIAKTLPWTLFVATIALVISFFIGTAIGARMAWKRKGAEEVIASSLIVVTSSIPDYLIGIILLYIFAYQLQLFPTNGAYDIMVAEPGFNFPFIWSCCYHAFLPILAYVIAQIGGWALSMKGSAVGVLGEDYINAARARGIPSRIIRKKYLKRNALLPLITSLALTFALLFGGSPIMESIFNYPGIGQQFSICIGRRDYFMVQGILFFISVVVIFVNLIADSIYSLIDPRIRRSA